MKHSIDDQGYTIAYFIYQLNVTLNGKGNRYYAV
jgi:hypothetical protein